MRSPTAAGPAVFKVTLESPNATSAANEKLDGAVSSSQKYKLNVAALTVLVLVRLANETPTNSTVPCPAKPRPNAGASGTSVSSAPPGLPPIRHRVTGQRSGATS